MSIAYIELQPYDLYQRIEKIHFQPAVALENIRAKYILLHKVLEQACFELTHGVTFSFANLFSRLDYICKEKRMTPSDKFAIQTLRRNCNAAMRDDFKPVMEEYLYDLRAMVRFISLAFEVDVPAELLTEIPHSNRPYKGTRHSRIPYVRAAVTSWNEELIFAATDSDEDPFIIINYAKGGIQGDLLYLHNILQENMQINLLDVAVDEENQYIPNLIVVHPDYLIDISSLANCFREYGRNPLNYFIQKVKPKANTAPILMGNLASQFLDDYVNEHADSPVTYNHTLKKFFATSALDFCTCPIPENFHAMAQAQMMNIRSFIQDVMPRNIHGFNKKQTMLEASFICEKLGLQGRVDMLQKDFKVLIEQKSGKRDEYHRRHKEDHFIQMMLYQGVLMYNFGHETENLQTFLLYSKYTDGLMIEHFAESLFRECISLRNRIVCGEMEFGEGAIEKVTEELSTDLLNEFAVHSKLWNDYQEPQLQEVINTLKRATPLEKAYFQRFFTFVSKELILSKTGGKNNPENGFAALWHMPVAEKLESGNILPQLKLTDKRQSAPGKGYDLLDFEIPKLEEDFLPNFRAGDMVICYAYQGTPDVRNEILMKGNIVEITPSAITVILRNGQQNKDIIGSEGETFAIEHDSSDISAGSAIRGLYAFLAARHDRKELLLGVRPPIRNKEITLNGDYGRFSEMILKEKQSEDYFLLVGPPGTGKTSCALRFMVEEALTEPDASLLLLSYTNRAVDEICNMLVDSKIAEQTPFIRIGNELSCDKRFVPFLLKNSLSDCPKLSDIQQKIIRTRIFVGTTTAISNRLHLFNLKKFSMAIIDEASQILEPDLIGILSARHNQENAIGKFVLIGDYKQLPAIAIQDEEEAKINHPLLQAIGLNDCRNSLFERLYKQSEKDFKSILHKQGRMHPAISEFPNHAFYFKEQLEPVPLKHQEEELPYQGELPETADALDSLVKSRRMVFIAARPTENDTSSEKSNLNEARITAVLLQRIYRMSKEQFNADKTVGVIVPYRNQIAMIRKEISKLNISDLMNISIDTVERYQGSQRDVIIYSFTIRNTSQLNFLTSNTFREGDFIIDRKLNVAITRARKQLFLTGNPEVLGGSLTFYKLMEYIRMHNGYIDTDTDCFCKGNFTVPNYPQQWDIQTGNYSLSDAFKKAFDKIVMKHLQPQGWTDTLTRELTCYGRSKLQLVEKDVAEKKELIHSYNRYYMCKQYAAAQALFEEIGHWLFPALRNVSGRVLFCDLSYECGSSALAFIDVCSRLPHLNLTYLGIAPEEEMETISRKFFEQEPYCKYHSDFYPRLAAIKNNIWNAHAMIPEVIVFNMSNLFDRIEPQEARELSHEINQLVHARPLNHYITIFRDDAGNRMNEHSYRAFCAHLTNGLKPIHEQMPYAGKFYYKNNETNTPIYDSYIYEVRSNK